MPKKKIKVKRIHFLLDKIRYEKLLKCAGEYNTLSDILNKAIDGYYYSVFKINNVEDILMINHKEEIIQAKNISNVDESEELERLKAERRARKENKAYLSSNEDEAEEFERLKAEALARRNIKKEGDSNA